MSNLGDIKKLYDKGFAIIYLREKEKRPIEMGWTSQDRKTWDELEASFEKRYNVGVRLGEPSRLISGKYLAAIDCDVKSQSRKAKVEMNEALRKLGIDLETAPIVVSGRGNGSKHVYVQTVKPLHPLKFAQSSFLCKVQMPSAKPSTRDKEKLSADEIAEGYRIRPAWEIAFMGTGQQTVLPDSTHPDTGMKYAWANPMQVKYLPTFDPTKFVSQTEKKLKERELDFKAEDVDLFASKLPLQIIRQITEGKGVQDRSSSLFTICMSMCRHAFTDNQILSVLSDPDNWISEAAYEHTQSRSRARAVKWLHKYTLTKARHETDIRRKFEGKPDQLVPLTKEEMKVEDDALKKVMPDTTGEGKPKSTQRNIIHILENELGGGLVGLDEFSNRVFFLKSTPYGGVKGRELTDVDDLHLKSYLANHYRFEPSKELCYEAHTVVAHKYRYHPVRAYLSGLKWDGVQRLPTWLKTAFKAVGPASYLEAISIKTLVAAVARVYEPGIKFDHVMILEGFQGKGKSTALRILAGDKWFTDSMGDIHQKDAVDQMTGKWIIELGELASIKKADVDFLKTFITRQTDRVRLPYGRRSADFERQSIFIGSTNNAEYFSDETGNRRYWPVKVEQADFKWLKTHRDQLWAEAVVMYELGEDLYLEPEIEAVANKEQSKRYMNDEWEYPVKKFLSVEGWDNKYTSTQIWRAIQNTPMGHPSDYEAKKIGKIMSRLGFSRMTVKIGGEAVKGWKMREGNL